jgi:hypothetical protein
MLRLSFKNLKVNKRAAYTQMSGILNAWSTSPKVARDANIHTFNDESFSPTENGSEEPTTTINEEEAISNIRPKPTLKENPFSKAAAQEAAAHNAETAKSPKQQQKAKSKLDIIASMSDAEFEENVKVLKQIAGKSIRSFAIFIIGILALWYARRKKRLEEEEEAKKEEVNDDDEESWKDLPPAERYLKEMKSIGFDVEGQDKERREMHRKEEEKRLAKIQQDEKK